MKGWKKFLNPWYLRARPSNAPGGPRYKLGSMPSLKDWNDALFTSMEQSGPVFVFKGEIQVGAYPWHTHWAVEYTRDGPLLKLFDVLHDFTQIGEHKPKMWDVVGHNAIPQPLATVDVT